MLHDKDESLMSQVAAGQPEALETLVRRHAHPLLTFIRRMIGDYHRSEEVFQEVFVAVWKKRRQFGVLRPFRPWLYAIALNACRAAMRRRRPVQVGLNDELAVVGQGCADQPDAVAVATEDATLVLAAVAQLPRRQRAVVALRVWSGMTYGEIAEVVGRSEGTVRAQMQQALAGLREYLEPRMR